MQSLQRLNWLRRILLVKVALCFVVWGLPALLAPPALLPLLGLSVPEDPMLLRSFGALAITMGVGYWYAYQDPVKNVAILKVGLVDNGLATLTVLLSAATTGASSWFAWLSSALTAFFFAALALLMPREQVT
jgi:hypothetical protein